MKIRYLRFKNKVKYETILYFIKLKGGLKINENRN